MIYFYLPNFYQTGFRKVNLCLIKQLREHPEAFYNDISIGAIYGNFPEVIWNGGRTMLHGDVGISEVKNIYDEFNSLGIPIRFTHTNCLINANHLGDFKANFLTSMADNGMNEILVNSPCLEEYLREVFPNFKYISSTTKCLLNDTEIEKESEKYYLTVLDYRKNMDKNYLYSLKNPERYEILLNAYCNPLCPKREQHYLQLSEDQLKNNNTDKPCDIRADNFYDSLSFDSVIKAEELYEKMVPYGFKHFKIEGRTNHIVDVINSYVYYMVKPNYQNYVRSLLLKAF